MESSTPFSMAYVLRTTTKHMRKALDISIRKTFDRFPEFANNPVKSKELFVTLAYLHTMRNNLDKFQAQNSKDFRG
jgi:hypothetical protein